MSGCTGSPAPPVIDVFVLRPSFECWTQVLIDLFSQMFSSDHHLSAELKSSLTYSLKCFLQTIIWVLNSSPHWFILSNVFFRPSYECWTQVLIDLFSQMFSSDHHLSAELKSSLTYSLKCFLQTIIWVLNSSPHWFILSNVFFRPSFECWTQVLIDLFSQMFSSDHHMSAELKSSLIYSLKCFLQTIIWVLNSSPHWLILSNVFFRPSYECWTQVLIDLFSQMFSSDHHMSAELKSSLTYSLKCFLQTIIWVLNSSPHWFILSNVFFKPLYWPQVIIDLFLSSDDFGSTFLWLSDKHIM